MVRSPTTMDLVVSALSRMGTGGSRRLGGSWPPGSCMETMTTTSYPLDGKAGTNIGKAMTDSSTHRLIEVRLAPISGEKADMLEGPSCADIVAKVFCTRDQNFFWLYTRLSCKDVGDLIA